MAQTAFQSMTPKLIKFYLKGFDYIILRIKINALFHAENKTHQMQYDET